MPTETLTPAMESTSACAPAGASCGVGGCGEKTVPLHVQELVSAVQANVTPLPYDVPPEDDPGNPWLARQLTKSWYNALQIAFEQLPTEPKRILHIGGCRQRDMARRLGFILPFAKITVVDADPAVVAQAEADIHCRFTFQQAGLPQLADIADNAMDLVIIPDVTDDTDDANRLLAECRRVVKAGGHVLVGQRVNWLNRLLHLFDPASLRILEMPPHPRYSGNSVEGGLKALGSHQLTLRPIPFHLHLYQMI